MMESEKKFCSKFSKMKITRFRLNCLLGDKEITVNRDAAADDVDDICFHGDNEKTYNRSQPAVLSFLLPSNLSRTR